MKASIQLYFDACNIAHPLKSKRSLSSGDDGIFIFPYSLKISKITSNCKKRASPNVSNYGPLSLLLTITKLYEGIIHNQLII